MVDDDVSEDDDAVPLVTDGSEAAAVKTDVAAVSIAAL